MMVKSSQTRRKRARPDDDDDDDHRRVKPSIDTRRMNAIILANTKPSYCRKKGIGSLHQDCPSLRSHHRRKLRRLLQTFMGQHKLPEAAGVLSLLLKGTTKEKALCKTRTKFTATLELLEHMEGDSISTTKVQNIYELWMKKLGAMKFGQMKVCFAVLLELILFCLKRGNTEAAHQAALCLMQERGFDSDPISNLVVGLAFYQLWYNTIPKELHLQELDRSGSPVQSETFEDRIYLSILNSAGHDAVEGQAANSLLQCDSNTSIRNDKEILGVDAHQQRETPMVVDDNVLGTQDDNFQPEDSYMNSAGRSYHEPSSMGLSGDVPYHSIFYSHGLPLWLLPLQLPPSNENLEDDLYRHRMLRNDYYKSAIKHLQRALYSNPPVLEAFHPLIQMLLLGDQVKEALDEVENFSPYSNTSFQLRLKAAILEHFDSGNHVKLLAIFEEILEKDPTCSHSLGRLISLHRSGDYSTEKLVEMIALHLDATHARSETWKELASCLLRLSQCEGDCMSVCFNSGEDNEKQNFSNQIYQIPRIFSNYESSKSWRFRCRWWLSHHFSQNILASDIASGDWALLTYKAATACYLYGREFMYVAKVRECLEVEPSNKNMSSILHMHANSCTGFYFDVHK